MATSVAAPVAEDDQSVAAEDGIGIPCTLKCYVNGSEDPILEEIRVIGIGELPKDSVGVGCVSVDDLSMVVIPGTKITLVKTQTPGIWRGNKDWRMSMTVRHHSDW